MCVDQWFLLEVVEQAGAFVSNGGGHGSHADPRRPGDKQNLVGSGELYPDVVDGPEEEGGVPSRLLKTDAGDGLAQSDSGTSGRPLEIAGTKRPSSARVATPARSS
jgi:hypothetical protein